jgi:hypothetical protein
MYFLLEFFECSLQLLKTQSLRKWIEEVYDGKNTTCTQVVAVKIVSEMEVLILAGKVCDWLQDNQNVAAIDLNLSNGSRGWDASTL